MAQSGKNAPQLSSKRKPDTRPSLVVPPDLAKALAGDPAAREVFNKLAYTHRREHIEAIVEAKKPETRLRRLEKTMTMLKSDRPSRSNTVSTRPAVEKMKIPAGTTILVLDADAAAMRIFDALPTNTVIDRKAGKKRYGAVVLYTETAAALAKRLPAAVAAAGPAVPLWVAYPKQSSGRATTLTRDIGWAAAERDDLETVTMIALDDVWAAVKYRVI